MFDEKWQLSGGIRVCVQCTMWIIRRAYQPDVRCQNTSVSSLRKKELKRPAKITFFETNFKDLVGEPGWPDGESFVKFKKKTHSTPLFDVTISNWPKPSNIGMVKWTILQCINPWNWDCSSSLSSLSTHLKTKCRKNNKANIKIGHHLHCKPPPSYEECHPRIWLRALECTNLGQMAAAERYLHSHIFGVRPWNTRSIFVFFLFKMIQYGVGLIS